MQSISLFYITATVVFALVNMTQILDDASPNEAFFMGYAVCEIQRLVDFQATNFIVIVAFNLTFMVLKFVIIKISSPPLIVLVIFLDFVPLILGFKAGKADRSLHHKLYKSKNQLLQFKQFLTENLPNQLIILTKDLMQTLFMNSAFQKSFNCSNITQLKMSLQRLVLEKHDMEKHKDMLKLLDYHPAAVKKPLQSIRLLDLVKKIMDHQNPHKELKTITFQVYEEKDETNLEKFNNHLEESIDTHRPLEQKSEFAHKNNHEKYYEDISVKRPYLTSPDLSPKIVKEASSFNNDGDEEEAALPNESNISQNKESLSKRVFKVNITPLTWGDQESLAFIFDDVSHERTIMELKIADKNKDLVIAMVSHELKTPLNGMLGTIEIIRKMLIKQPNIIPYLNACKNSGLMLLNLVNSILDMSQIKKNKLKLVYAQICLLDLLNEVKSLFDHFCMVKNLYLNIEVHPDVPFDIVTDETRLKQVLINLVGNAFKFTFKGGITIKVDLENNDPSKLKFRIEDTGIGIKNQDQEKLFKFFGRIDQKDERINTNGVGLGLTISNTIVLLLNPNGGNKGIHVESEVDKGTTFSFVISCGIQAENTNSTSSFGDEWRDATNIFDKLNVYQFDEDQKRLDYGNNLSRSKSKCLITALNSKSFLHMGGPESDTRLPNMTSSNSVPDFPLVSIRKSKKQTDLFPIFSVAPTQKFDLSAHEKQDSLLCLIVDDNPFNLMVATNLIHDRGYTVQTALNGQEAIYKVKEQEKNGLPFNLILMDCQMPVMDGYEATKRLKAMMAKGEIAKTPIIAVTANNRDEEHDKHCFDVGMMAILSKPINIEEMDTLLQKISLS